MSARIVLAPGVLRRSFHDLAISAKWILDSVVDAGDAAPYEEIWIVNEENAAVHYIEDDLLGVAYLQTTAMQSDELRGFVAERLNTLDAAEVLAWAYIVDDPEERIQAVGYLTAVAASGPSDAFVDVLAEIARDARPDVRRAVLFACAYLSWPALDSLVEQLRKSDPDPHVREDAARTEEAILRHRGQ